MKNKKLHMIGNAHLDPVWLWQWQEGFQEVKATFRSALDRLAEYEQFIFTSSQAAVYEWIEHHDPSMFAEIRKRIAEGRWVLCGGWWVQADCLIPSGESFARQALYGQRYFQEKFNKTAKVGYNVDSFGHHAMLPQLLKKSGMDFYVFMRPGPHEKELPCSLFWWESDDGSRVLTYRVPLNYCTRDELEKEVNIVMQELGSPLLGAPLNEMMMFYGVGNHGGGPTKANIEEIGRLNQDSAMPNLIFSSPEQYFREMTGNYPVVHDDLLMHAKGCYSVHSGVKRWNREAENLLLTAEKWSAVAAALTGQSYPQDMGKAWKNVLFNQFHDILPGSSIEAAYDDARDAYGEAKMIANRALNHALQSISWRISIEQEEGVKPFVVFNSHTWPVKLNVEVDFGLFGIGLDYNFFNEHDRLVDHKDQEVAMQPIKSASSTIWRHRFCFTIELPALGYRVFRMCSSPAAESAIRSAARKTNFTALEASECSAESERFRLELDTRTGFIASLYDKVHRHEVFRDQAARPVVIDDPSDTWSHGIVRYDKEIGVFTLKRLYKLEHGLVRTVLRAESEYGKSTLIQDFIMYNGLDYIDVRVRVNWQEQFKMLKLKFPVGSGHSDIGTYEIPYGHIERAANGEEVPGQSWFDCSGCAQDGKTYGVSILNDGKYSFDMNNGEMGMTVLRSPIYAHDSHLIPDSDGDFTFMDQGSQRFRYRILPHTGSWKQAQTVQRAAELNQPPVTVIETCHQGSLPQQDSFISVNKDNVLVTVMKKAEDNNDLVIRCYETHKQQTDVTVDLKLWDRTVHATLSPCEIKTLCLPADPDLQVAKTDLLEWAD